MARRGTAVSPPPVGVLIEESVHLLRQHPRELVTYYAGTGPFAVGLLYFWAYVTWFVPADGMIALGALALTGLFAAMKAAQNRFAQQMLARRLEEEVPPWTGREWIGEAAAQLRLQAIGLVLLPLSAVFGVPFGWIYAHFQNATIIAAPPESERRGRAEIAWAQATLWPAQNHWGLGIFGVLWLMVALNIGVASYLVPTLASNWLGLNTVFTLSGWSYWNTTFLLLVVVITHLLVDPFIKIFYVLRVFHGRAQFTGADLRLVLGRERAGRRRALSSLGVVVLLAGLSGPAPAEAAERADASPTPVAIQPITRTPQVVQLDRAIDQVLQQPEFRWRLQPLPVPKDRAKDGVVRGFLRATVEVIAQMARSVYRTVQRIGRWIDDVFGGKKSEGSGATAERGGKGGAFDWMAALQLIAYILLVAIVGVLLFVGWKVWMQHRLPPPSKAKPAPTGTPDLNDETVEASRLPADGWLELARAKLAAGEWRLALRALFLATLARHAHEGRLALARHKTNLDYELELRRRSLTQTAVPEEFRRRRRLFEDVWYGTEPASDAVARGWLQEMEAGR